MDHPKKILITLKHPLRKTKSSSSLLSNPKRIKVKLRKPTNSKPNAVCSLTQDQLSQENWHKVNNLRLTRELLKLKMEVEGDKITLVNLIRRAYYHLPPIVNDTKPIMSIQQSKAIIYRFMCNTAFKNLGNTIYRDECNNDSDLLTVQDISQIPTAYLFCLEEQGTWYGFDLRTLNTLFNKQNKYINPYTSRPVTESARNQINRKINLIYKLNFPIEVVDNYYNNLSEEGKFKYYLNELFQKLYKLDYNVDVDWLHELSFQELQRLYAEVADIWSHRVPIPKELRLRIVKNGIVFAETHIIDKMKPGTLNRKLLLKKISKNLDRLITEGETVDDRKLGATYFMIGFSIVSPKVAESYPYLHDSAESYE